MTVVAELPDGPMKPEQAAAVASGLRLRAYKFDRYKTKKKDGEDAALRADVSLAVGDVAAARKAFAPDAHIVDGVIIARDLVNEPPNVLYSRWNSPAAPAQLRKLGVEVEVLDVKAMTKLGMGALLGVAQGSAQPGRTVIMRWNGGKRGDQPVAFVGKGVCFDTGGISIKGAASMEDMKGDMGGAACVVGLMHALAARKAKVNAVGAIGLVENMPDGNAQRPGDIVTSMSGQTIEIINTDAEGRLVLADVLWYVAKKFKPKFMVDLATLTGAIMVALGTEYAGLFSNNDELAERLTKAGLETGERVWRMPLGPEYDKQINSQFADMKNTGGRTAARSPRRSSCSASSTTRHGRISISRERRWARRKPKSTRAGVRAMAFACWSGWSRSITKPKNSRSRSPDDGSSVLPSAGHDAGKRPAAACSKSRWSAAGGSSCSRHRRSAPTRSTPICGPIAMIRSCRTPPGAPATRRISRSCWRWRRAIRTGPMSGFWSTMPRCRRTPTPMIGWFWCSTATTAMRWPPRAAPGPIARRGDSRSPTGRPTSGAAGSGGNSDIRRN